MAAQHMPGPWQVGYRGTTVMGASPNAKVCDIRGWGYLTGKGDGALGLTEDEAVAVQSANAALIAAAPDLLVQLKSMLGLARFIIKAADLDPEATTVVLRNQGETVAEVPVSVLLTNTEAAIAKAEGR